MTASFPPRINNKSQKLRGLMQAQHLMLFVYVRELQIKGKVAQSFADFRKVISWIYGNKEPRKNNLDLSRIYDSKWLVRMPLLHISTASPARKKFSNAFGNGQRRHELYNSR